MRRCARLPRRLVSFGAGPHCFGGSPLVPPLPAPLARDKDPSGSCHRLGPKATFEARAGPCHVFAIDKPSPIRYPRTVDWSPAQAELLSLPLPAKVFLSGRAGSGKTSVGVEHCLRLLSAGVPGNRLLVLTPQRTLQEPYRAALQGLPVPWREAPFQHSGGEVTLATVGGLARRMCDLFWPLIAADAGFAHPDQPPVFLTIETAQYHMARLVRPMLADGRFDTVTIDRNRLYSQILDNLNKSAGVGFAHTEIGARLDAAWYGEPAQRRVYVDAQEAASRFREYCLANNLLDFSLQMELFQRHLWPLPACRQHLQREYAHLVYDNAEEDIPVAHDLLLAWLPAFESALVILDRDGGYRRFLGADPESALRLAAACEHTLELQETFVASDGIRRFEQQLLDKLVPGTGGLPAASGEQEAPVSMLAARFTPELLDAVAARIRELVEAGTPPSAIVVLAPYLSDALRFSLGHRLESLGIPWQSHRPSRSLRDEPASQCLVTLACLAHPQWGLQPGVFDVAYALMQSLEGLDLVRARLLAEIVYRRKEMALSSFDQIIPAVQQRISFVFGNRYGQLRSWLEGYRQEPPLPLDHFLRRLFGELLSQTGFGFHANLDPVRVAASLVESVQKFRQALDGLPADRDGQPVDLGREYVLMLQEGVIAAQYLESWQPPAREAVLLAPAFTYLMMNRPVDVQFWLDAGSAGWWERLSQPLTQPYVLSRAWLQTAEAGRLWTDADEVSANQETLVRLVSGLLCRCREQVVLGVSSLGEQGFEQRGPLLKAVWRLQMEQHLFTGETG